MQVLRRPAWSYTERRDRTETSADMAPASTGSPGEMVELYLHPAGGFLDDDVVDVATVAIAAGLISVADALWEPRPLRHRKAPTREGIKRRERSKEFALESNGQD